MNCIVGQSGGPTSVINSTLAGVIKAAFDKDFDKVFGSRHGIEGIINDNIVEFDKDKFNENYERLMARPAAALGSCRYKLPEDLEDEVYEKIFNRLKDLEVSHLVYIGGNDSMDTVMKLNAYRKKNKIEGIYIMGAPKTIDNDLFGMDHSPGFGSAAKFVAGHLKTVRIDADIYDLESVSVVEIMGRNAGWLTASALLANQEREMVNLVYLSEMDLSKEELLEDVKRALTRDKNVIIAVSEGFMDRDGYFKTSHVQSHDSGFNHPMVAGVGKNISDYIHEQLDIKTKAIELNVLQRTSMLISETDAKEAYQLGYKAIEYGVEGHSGVVSTLYRDEKADDYRVIYDYVEVETIANKEKKIPSDWFDEKNNSFDQKLIDYLQPLIKGEIKQEMVDGLPVFINLDELIK